MRTVRGIGIFTVLYLGLSCWDIPSPWYWHIIGSGLLGLFVGLIRERY